MKHCFIINPRAGKGLLAEKLRAKVTEICEKRGEHYDVFLPDSLEASFDYIKRTAEAREEELSFYACGGDGTLCETVNGVMRLDSREGVSVGVMPIGTGNDFVRNFTPKEQFLEPDAQLDGTSCEVDLLRCNDMYAINMVNVGFDSEVVAKKETLSGKRFVPAKMAYILGLVICLARKPGVSMRVSCDGGEYEKKKLLLTTFANGGFCGGGFYSNPGASLCDGRIDAMEIKNVSRTRFLTLVGSYKKGTHIREKLSHIIHTQKGEEFHMLFDSPMHVSVDGELKTLEELRIKLEKGALRLRIPKGVSPVGLAMKGLVTQEAVLT